MGSQLCDTMEFLNMYFVIPENYESSDECSNDMLEAFDESQNNNMNPKWITAVEVNSITPTKADIFVLQEFKGDQFERLKAFECFRIVGPRCIIRCFVTGDSIPPGTSPIFTTPMKNLVICTSGLTSEMAGKIREKIEFMGGLFCEKLRSHVTHLISDSVTTLKYEMATEKGIEIFTHEWVLAVWEKNLTDFIPATDEIFDKYKCPVFMNLVVTVSNLTRNKKAEVKELIESHGGKFMGALDGAIVKVVITDEFSTLSDKLKYAMKHSIPCVKSEWVKQSIKKGYALPFTDYLIQESTRKQCSTPDGPCASLNISTISNIPSNNSNNYVNETMSMILSGTLSDQTENRPESNIEYFPILDNIEIRAIKKAGPFLDGCNIYLAGFASQQRDKINKILNIGSATRLDDISDSLTHVLVGDSKKASNELKIVASRGLHPHILTIEWLVESIKLKKPAPEAPYLLGVESRKATEPPASPLSKKNLQMLQRPKRPPVPLFNLDKSPHDEPDIVQQYLKKSNLEDTLKIPSNDTMSAGNQNKTALVSRKNPSHSRNSTNTTMNDTEGLNTEIFTGKIFRIVGFESEENEILIKNITSGGGQVVPNSYTGIPDFGIVPLSGAPLRHTVDEIVTNLYIDDCMDHNTLVEITYYHRPLSIPANAKPLANCVVAMSAYMGVERMYLTYLAVTLGACHQDSFARKTNIAKKQLGATHLICAQPEGSKYAAAVKWKLPAVTCDWLKECAAKLRLVDETPYLVGETVAPEKDHSANTSMNSSTTSVPAPQSQRQPDIERPPTTPMTPMTPIVNKHLNKVRNDSSTVSSDFKTPESPYGLIYHSNPSPRTKKAYAQYFNSMSSEKLPPAKRRPVSTPLSEIKRTAWSEILNPKTGSSELTPNQSISADVTVQSENNSRGKQVETALPVNRALQFDVEANSEITAQLQEMEKVLQSTTKKSSTVERRVSAASDKEDDESNPNFRCIETQAESVGWEDPRTSLGPNLAKKHIIVPSKRRFMISGVRDRTEYMKVIEDLGGEVSLDNFFDETSTHLICMRPQRNEKLLGSIAAGKWVLHAMYIQACDVAGEFIDEEKYEWGNEKSQGIIPSPQNDCEYSLAHAAHRWRLAVSHGAIGAFEDMVAMIIAPKDKYEQFERFICAGGGEVVQMKPPYNFSPSQHLNLCLTTTEPLNPRDHVIPDFKKYLALLPK